MMKDRRLFRVFVFLIVLGFGVCFLGFGLSSGVSVASPSWVLYLEVVGLDVFFFSGAIMIFSIEFERKPRRIFKGGVGIFALCVLSYVVAGWVIKGVSLVSGHPLNAWGLFSLNKGSWVWGFNILLIGIAVSGIEGLEMMVVGGVRFLKQWIEKTV